MTGPSGRECAWPERADQSGGTPAHRTRDSGREWEDVDVEEPASTLTATTLVLVTGPPATGKSTLAERAAAMLAAPVFSWDWAMAALRPFTTIQWAFRVMDREHGSPVSSAPF
jgi:hypothetical protein